MPSLREVTETQLREWEKNESRRLQLEREASALESANKLIEQQIDKALRAEGKARATRFGFQLDFVDGRPVAVKWKEAFIERNGADEASKLQAAAASAPRAQKLRITPPPTPVTDAARVSSN